MSQIRQVIKPQAACAALKLAPLIQRQWGWGVELMLILALSWLVAALAAMISATRQVVQVV